MKNYIKLNGWSWGDGLKLIREVEAHNGGSKAKLFCTEKSLINLFNSYPHFGIHDIIVDDNIVIEYSKDALGIICEDLLVIESPLGATVGIIWV